VAILLAAAGRLSGVGTVALAPAAEAPQQSRDLRFTDRDDGAIVVHDAAGNGVVTVLASGSNGFIRGVMRGLARDRMLRGIGEEPPFHLARGTDGRLILSDPATGRVIALDAFGQTNAGAFARLLDGGGRS
jgi:putative photosynthetic complex assembly protein